MKSYAEQLKLGKTISFRPVGNSMQPKIYNKQLVTLSPDITNLIKDDIVLCKVKGRYYLHLISDIKENRYRISNNKGYINGWITIDNIFGKVIKIGE